MSTVVKSEIDDEYSNSSESDGPVDLSEGTLRVFSDIPEPPPRKEKPQNQVIEVMVDGKIQIFEIQPVEATMGDDGIISYTDPDTMTPYTSEAEYINLDTSTGHQHHAASNPHLVGGHWQSQTSMEAACMTDQISSTTHYYTPAPSDITVSSGGRYTGPIEISYPTNVLYPPPPSEAGHDTHNILIQRAPTRGGRKEGKTGANR